MKNVRIVSRLLFIITRITSLGYLLAFALSSIALSTGWSLNLTDHETRFEVCYPFTHYPFLLGEYNAGYITGFLCLLGLYSLFFFLVSNIFYVFLQPKLFTTYGIRQLKRFYQSNLLLPLMASLAISPFYSIDKVVETLVILHAILGVFAYFIAAIFEQGIKLQNDQDLII
jgi:hypothetical protein